MALKLLGLNPLIIREELQPALLALINAIKVSLNPLIIREELQLSD